MATDVPDLDHFTHDDAWSVGSALVATCRERELPVTICIHLGSQRVFHVGVKGSTADLDRWVARKTRVVQNWDLSSMEVSKMAGDDFAGFLAAFGLSLADYFPSGGAVPIRVRGTTVGVLALSGVDSPTEHGLAIDALTRFKEGSL